MPKTTDRIYMNGEDYYIYDSALKSALKQSVTDGNLPLDLGDCVNSYCSNTVGSVITFTTSSASKTYKKIIDVKKGHKYIVKVTAPATLASNNARTSCVTDKSNVIKQTFDIQFAANKTFINYFVAQNDGYLYLCVDKNTTDIVIQGGLIYENQERIEELEAISGEYVTIKRNYFDFTQAITGKYIDGDVGSAYVLKDNANYWSYIMPVEAFKTYVLRRTDYRWIELDENGIVLDRYGNSNPAGYVEAKPKAQNVKYIGFAWTTVNPVDYMVLDPGVSFDNYIAYPGSYAIKSNVLSDSGLITKNVINPDIANDIINGFTVKQNFFDPSTAVTGKYISGDVGGALRPSDNASYAYNVIPVEFGKTYVLSRSDYAWFEFNADMNCVKRNGNNTGTNDLVYTPSRNDVKYVGVSWLPSMKAVNAYMATYQGVDRSEYIPYPCSVSSNVPYNEREIHIGTGKDYTSIMAAFKAYENDTAPKKFIIDAGVYDIYTELGGAEFLATIGAGDNWADVSTIVPENSKVIGIGSVTLLYQPDAEDIPSDNAISCISPINVRGSVEIENITIICKNCRYAIHDETGTNSRYNNTKKAYKNVRAIKLVNDYVPSGSVISGQSFGCGFGAANDYQFENCYFKSNVTAFSMHNNPTTADYQGTNVTIKNCMFDTDATQTMRFGAVYSEHAMENIINMHGCYIKSRVTVTREAAENGADNTFNLTLVNCSDIETLDDFKTHDSWHSDYEIKVFNPIEQGE